MAGHDPAIQSPTTMARSFLRVHHDEQEKRHDLCWHDEQSVAPGLRASGRFDRRLYEKGLKSLVYFEVFQSVSDAIQRESNLEHWPRKWKLELIESLNPEWKDLTEEGAW